MRFGKASEVQQFESGHIVAIARQQRGQHIAVLVVPRSRGSMRMPRGDDLEFRKRWIGDKALVRIYINSGRVIDCDEPSLVKIIDLLHGLGKRKAEPAIA